MRHPLGCALPWPFPLPLEKYVTAVCAQAVSCGARQCTRSDLPVSSILV